MLSMRSRVITVGAVWAVLMSTTGFSQGGYDVQLEIKPYKNQWVYLAYYYGGIKGLADSAFLNNESKGVFKGTANLPQGIYIVASPTKTILFEMLMAEDQQFSVKTDTLNLEGSLQFEGSVDNDQFLAYTRFIGPQAFKADSLRKALPNAAEADKSSLTAQLNAVTKSIYDYRAQFVEQHPESMLAALFKGMTDVELPANLRSPKTRADSLAQYRWGKEHYWDGIDFMDGRMVRTPILESKLKAYLEQWVSPEPDSVIAEFNWMIALGRNDPEMFRYLIGYFVDNYMYPKLMGQDKVFLHVYEKFIAGDQPKANWLNERQMKAIRERAYMLMANQLGTAAWDMELVDTAGKVRSLYSVKAPYTIVAFWDVHCGKCKEDMPKMDSLYRRAWKQQGVQVYAVMVNEASLIDWKPFIRKLSAGWVHVHQTEAMRDEEQKAGKPNYRQLYDMRSTPTLFLLDKDKKIIAKNLGLEDLDKVLQQRIKQQKT